MGVKIDYQTQRAVVSEFRKHGSYSVASRVTGVHPQTCSRIVKAYDRYGESFFSDYPEPLK